MTAPQTPEPTPAVERVAVSICANGRNDDIWRVLDESEREDFRRDAHAALDAALSGRVLGADEMHTEAAAALFGGPDIKTPHMPKRDGESYMDWCDRVAAVAVDAIRAALLGGAA